MICPLCATEPAPMTIQLLVREVRHTGVWCPTCLLPSVVVCTLAFGCRHGWPGSGAGTVAWCRDHEGIVKVPLD